MKKILFASTALTMFAGIASADVTLSGSGYFGLDYDNDAGVGEGPLFDSVKTRLLSRLQLDIAFSTTTDTGLTFFGSYRIRDNASGFGQHDTSTTPVNGGKVGVSSGGLSLAVGNATNAIDAMNTYYDSEIGLCGCGGEVLDDQYFQESESRGPGNDGILASYTAGGLVARLSYEQQPGNGSGDGEYGVSVDYATGPFSVGLGYVKGTNPGDLDYSGAVIVAEYTVGAYNLGFAAGKSDLDGPDNDNGMIYTLYGKTTFGATTVQAFISSAEDLIGEDVGGESEKTTYGLGATYDLGSGAAIVGHVRTTRTDDTVGDLGVSFKF